MGDKTANMMKFAVLALALSAIATQAASYDKVDAVVPEELVEAPAPAPAPAAPTCSNDHLATDDHSGCQIFWYHAHVGCGGGHMSKEEAVAKVPGYTKCTTKAYKKCKRENRKDFDTCCHCSNSEENTENESAPAPAPAAPTCSNDHLATDDHSGCQIFWYHAHVGCGGGHMSKEQAVAKVPGYKKCTNKAYMKCRGQNRKNFGTCCHCSN